MNVLDYLRTWLPSMKGTYNICHNYLFDMALFVTSAMSTYLLWVFLHFMAAQTYIKYCVGNTWSHMVLSIFYVSSPFCQGVSWVIFHGSRNIYFMWFVLGSFLSKYFVYNWLTTPYTKPYYSPSSSSSKTMVSISTQTYDNEKSI